MAAQVELEPGVVTSRLHLSPLTDSSNKTLMEDSAIISSDPKKPVPGPKPRLTPKPFAVQRNTVIRPILAPKPQPRPKPETLSRPEPPGKPKPKSPTLRAGATPTSEPVSSPKDKPDLSPALNDPDKPKPPETGGLVRRTSLGPSASQSKPTELQLRSKTGPSITRAKSMGFLSGVGLEEDPSREADEVVRRPQETRSTRPRPVSATFLQDQTTSSTSAPTLAERRPLLTDLTARFEPVRQPALGDSSKENTPAAEDGIRRRERQHGDVWRKDVDGQDAKLLERAGSGIKRRISLLLDSSSSVLSLPVTRGSEPRPPVPTLADTDGAVGVKQRIKELTEDLAPAPPSPQKPQFKPRPLPTDRTKCFASDAETPSPSEFKGVQEGAEDLGRKSKDLPSTVQAKPQDDRDVTGGVQTVRAALFENVVEKHNIQMEDADMVKPTPRQRLSMRTKESDLFGSLESERDGSLVKATYQGLLSPSSPKRIDHVFDMVAAVEENRAVSENIPSAQLEEKALTLRRSTGEDRLQPAPLSDGTKGNEENSFKQGSSNVLKSKERQSTGSVAEKSNTRVLRVGALAKWEEPFLDREVKLEMEKQRKMLKDMEEEIHRQMEVNQAAKAGIEEDDLENEVEMERGNVSSLREPKVPETEDQQTTRPKATYFALTGQMNEVVHQSAGMDEERMFRSDTRGIAKDKVKPETAFEDFSVKVGQRGFKNRVPSMRRNQISEPTIRKTSPEGLQMAEGTQWHPKENEYRRAMEQELERQKLERLKELEQQQELEIERERQREMERERERQREMERERERQRELERERERQRELERERERQKEMERERERQRELERERERQKEMGRERERQREMERERERQKEMERERERQREMERERERQKQLERERESERQRERQKEMERQKQLEKERQNQIESERRQKELERERERILEDERMKLREYEKEQEIERERKRQSEQERKWEIERRELERQKEQEKQKAMERQKQLAEMERWMQSEKQKELDREKRRQMDDLKKIQDLERHQLLEFQLQKDGEREKRATSKNQERVEEGQRETEQGKRTAESPLRPKVLDLDNVSLGDRYSKNVSSDQSPTPRWKQPSNRDEGTYKPSILDVDSFKNQTQSVDVFGMPAFSSLDSVRAKPMTPTSGAKSLSPVRSQSMLQNLQRNTPPQSQIQAPFQSEQARLPPPLQPQVLNQPVPVDTERPKPQMYPQSVPPDWTRGAQQFDTWSTLQGEEAVDEPLWLSSTEIPKNPVGGKQSSVEQILQRQEERSTGPFSSPSSLTPALTPVQSSGLVRPVVPPSHATSPGHLLTPERILNVDSLVAGSRKENQTAFSQLVPEPVWSPSWEPVFQHPNQTSTEHQSRTRSRSVNQRSALVETSVDGPLARLRSRSAHRDKKQDSWEQLKQRGQDDCKDTDTLVQETDSQYGTWGTGQHTDDSLTPVTPSSDSNLIPSPRKPALPHTPDQLSQEEQEEPLNFPQSPTVLLDSSAQRSKAQLSKSCRRRRAPPSRAARHSAVLPDSLDFGTEEWRFKDSTEDKPDSARQQDEESDEDEPPRAADTRTSSSSVSSQPQRVALFPGMDPSALMVQLKKRGESESQTDGPSPSQLSRSPKSPFLGRASRVLPPVGGKENGEESSPQWLKELKSKKRFSQIENDS